MTVRLRINQAGLTAAVNDRGGPVLQQAAAVAQQIKAEARRQVGVSRTPSQTRGGRAQHLRDAIVTRIVRRGGRTVVEVAALRPYATFHHDGTRPHVIVPRRAKALRFTVGRQVVFATRVHHPGTRPNRFLSDPARRLGLEVRRVRGN